MRFALKVQGLSDTLGSFQSEFSRQLSLDASGFSAPGPIASGGIMNDIAASQVIDQLSGTTITDALLNNVTVNGVSGLTTSDIPDLSSEYLPASGGTIAGTILASNIDASSAAYTTLLATNATGKNMFVSNLMAITASFGGIATSSFANNGALDLAQALTVPNGGTGWTNIAAGAIPFGNGASALATSSDLYWNNIKRPVWSDS